jgi:hypothetical protein
MRSDPRPVVQVGAEGAAREAPLAMRFHSTPTCRNPIGWPTCGPLPVPWSSTMFYTISPSLIIYLLTYQVPTYYLGGRQLP